MFKRILLIGLFIIASSFTMTSSTSANEYIKSGEQLTFIASYNMSGVMTDIAEVKMETSTVKTKTRTLLRLKCTASTYSKWDAFFKVRDLYESYVDPETLLPVLFKRNIEEGNYKKELKYLFNRKNYMAVSTMNKKGFKDYKTDIKIDTNTLDIVSTIYSARAFDFDNFSIGNIITKNLIVDSSVQSVSVQYLGKETISVAKYGKKECYKLSIGFGGGDIENIEGGKYIWITADEDRFPALIEANIPVGAIQIRLSDYSN